MENGGRLGSTADERSASLNLENVSPKEGVGGSIPSEAATVFSLTSRDFTFELCALPEQCVGRLEILAKPP